MRVNRGPAVQLTALGSQTVAIGPHVFNTPYFRPSGVIYVGGVSSANEINLRLSIGDSLGFIGKIYEVAVNADTFRLRDATLVSHEMYVDAASATVSGK